MRHLPPRPDRSPLRVMFVTTGMTVGGQEMLLLELIRGLDRSRFAPELCCLKDLGPLGDVLTTEVPTYAKLLTHKFDVCVGWRLARLMRRRRIDAVVTVGTGGDRMFWGRLAAWQARVPVIVSALHATGWPTRVEWPNRLLSPLTDAFVAVGEAHARHVIEAEGCPAHKVWIVPNGIDTARFRPRPDDAARRAELGLPLTAPVVGIVARIRAEKNHQRFLRVAARVRHDEPSTHFLVVGAGAGLDSLTALAGQLGLGGAVHFCGSRLDVPELLATVGVFLLTSDIETSPVSILEAMASGKPVVATRVGSVPELVTEGVTGYLGAPNDEALLAARVIQLLRSPDFAAQMGQAGREQVVALHSVERMVDGYEQLVSAIYARKCSGGRAAAVNRQS